jgi:peptide-methionine (S)-S-oxide reductase
MKHILILTLLFLMTQLSAAQTRETVTLGAGCFWCVEAIYERLNGVYDVKSGYSGGHVANPTYRQVTTGTSGHAEVIRFTYDPAIISFDDILRVFFATHNPTTLNRQGADVGPQYRSVIYFHNAAQKASAERNKKEIGDAKIWDAPIVTEISPLINYYVAEDYHQDYYENNQNAGYCQVVIAPKVRKFMREYSHLLKN